MRILKQGPMEQLKRRKCRLRNHMTLEEGVRKRKNHKKTQEQG
jgi:hypothetical protein